MEGNKLVININKERGPDRTEVLSWGRKQLNSHYGKAMLAVAPMVVFDRTSSMLDVNSVEPTCVEQAILESFKVKFSTVVPKA